MLHFCSLFHLLAQITCQKHKGTGDPLVAFLMEISLKKSISLFIQWEVTVGAHKFPLGWTALPVKCLWKYVWHGKRRRTWHIKHVCLYERLCVWAHASCVFSVSFCLALMKEFMFNSETHPHIYLLFFHTTSIPVPLSPLSLLTGLFLPFHAMTPSPLCLPPSL